MMMYSISISTYYLRAHTCTYVYTYVCMYIPFISLCTNVHTYVCIIARINSVIIAGNRSRFVCPFISGWSIVIALANRVAIANPEQRNASGVPAKPQTPVGAKVGRTRRENRGPLLLLWNNNLFMYLPKNRWTVDVSFILFNIAE